MILVLEEILAEIRAQQVIQNKILDELKGLKAIGNIWSGDRLQRLMQKMDDFRERDK